MLSIMMKLVIPEDKLQSPYGLSRIYRKYMPDISREIYVMEALPLNPGTLRTAQVDGELVTKYITTRQTRFGEHSLLVEAVTNFIVPWPSISISQAVDDFLYMSIAYSARDNEPKTDAELEYYGRIGTMAFKCTGWSSGSDLVCSTSYLRSITQKLALGSQLTLRHFALPQPNQKSSDITYYARYRGSAYTACLDFCKSSGYHFSYFRNINKYSACAIDIVGSVNFKQVKGTVALKTKVPKYGLVTTAHLTSDGAITGVFKKRFSGDFPISIMISGFYNFFAGECGFGIGLIF
uniref:Mitochondrial import receptor subunit TOM40 n=1 Tax=Loa loa TaxID=7209 RepID=A0A1I7VLS6_LOALO